MKVLEDLIAPAVMSDLVCRLISFLIGRYVKRTCWEEPASRLELLALKIHAVVDEAEQRQITKKRRLLLWLKKLMEGMYRAYYVVDAARHRHDGCVLLLSRSRRRKRLRTDIPAGDHDDNDLVVQLSVVLASLECSAADLNGLIQLLACCPTIQRQRRAADFRSDDKCMFGRLIEREQIISFLTHLEANLGILPVIGGPEVGKGTIVKHVCDDERVRDHFDVILYSYGSLLEVNCTQDILGTLRSGGHVLHQEPAASDHGSRHLLVIKNTYELVINKASWTALCASLRAMANGSKIIIVSENDRIAELGTVDPLRVRPLPREEYWYFFRSLALGSNDPKEHPNLAALGRQIAAALHGSFFGAKVLGRLLRSNLDAQFWCSVLNVVACSFQAMTRGEKHFTKLGIAEMALKVLPVPLKIKGASQSNCGPSEFPAIAVQELLHVGRVPTSEEEMQVLLWESACPPNYRYTVVCENIRNHPCGATATQGRRRIPGRTRSVGN